MKRLRTRINEMYDHWERDALPKETLRTFAERRCSKTNKDIINSIGWFNVCFYYQHKYKKD